MNSTVTIAIKIHQRNFILFHKMILITVKMINDMKMKISGRNELMNALNRCLLEPKRFN